MANYERGVYEPSDEVRVFDASEDEEDVEGSRLPLLIVLALVVLFAFAGVVWLAYTQGVARGRGETPVLTAAAGPERVAPSQAGGNVPYQGFKIYEQPAPPDDVPEAAPKAEAKPEAPKPEAAKPETPPPQQMTAPKPEAAKPVAPATKPAPETKAAAAPPPKTVAALIQQANNTPAAAKPVPPPAAKPTVTPAAPPAPLGGPATGAPRQLGQAAAPAPVAAKPAPAATGSYVLQIGAYKSQAEADTAWKTYKAKHAALLSGYGPNIVQADLGEKGTWYRLRIAGFSDREVASALCDRLKADGGGCFLGK